MASVRCIPQLTEAQKAGQIPLDSPAFAAYLDSRDVLAPIRSLFEVPGASSGEVYLCAHALGAMPVHAPRLLNEEIESWKETGAPGHSHLKNKAGKPWTTGDPSGGIDERYVDVMADLIGAIPTEVAWMGGLTSNLHSLMSVFYRPVQSGRHKILYEADAFPSDRLVTKFAFHSQVAQWGLDPQQSLLGMSVRSGEHTLRTADILDVIQKEGSSIALIIFGAVHWGTGHYLDMEAITRAGKAAGCIVGWDCAHAAGNVPMRLHEWNVDFAVWCTYKYLCGGPGATAGIFVHEKHFEVPRQSGWWGHELKSRFVYSPNFIPRTGAAGFAVSNPSVFATVPVHASMQVYDIGSDLLKVTRQQLIALARSKSILLTGYLEHIISLAASRPNCRYRLQIVSPADSAARGSCLCLTVSDAKDSGEQSANYSPGLTAFCAAMERHGVVVDKRAPDLVRLSPHALYNTFSEVWALGQAVMDAIR